MNNNYFYQTCKERIKSEYKIYLVALILAALADFIKEKRFSIGLGTIILFPVFYAIIFGVLAGPEVGKIFSRKEVKLASKLVIIGICPFVVKLGITAGANIDLILNAGPALLVHGFGNLLGPILAVPVAMALGMKEEAIGACSSLNREYHMAIINDTFGADSKEAEGSMAIYVVGGMIGTIYFGIMASVIGATGIFDPQALGMATGVGAGIFMASASASLATMFPDAAQTITTMASASNTIAGITGIYITMFIALPMTKKLYTMLSRISAKRISTEG